MSLFLTQTSQAEQGAVQTIQARFKTSFEEVTLPGDEKMGFLGGSFLYDVNSWLSVGPSAYGALTGQRGGFITLGLTADARYPLADNLELSASYFVGAGGGRGGYTLSGGGLMLRSSLGLDWDAGRWGRFGVGVSNLDFPNGAINSTQPYLSYTYPFTTLIGKGWLERPRDSSGQPGRASSNEQEFAAVVRHYQIPDGVLTDAGAPQHDVIQLLGVEWTRYLNNNAFLRLESEGAMGGESNGYMQILLGGGYRVRMGDSTALKLSLSAGVAGGGGVATGGGLLLDGQAALQQDLTDNLFVEVGAGYVRAPQSDFEAISLAGKLGYRFGTPKVRKGSVPLAALAPYQLRHFRFRMTNQSYLRADPLWRTHHADENVDNLGVQVDYFLNNRIYLTGQGVAAYSGNAGAYMAGLVGAGIHQYLFDTRLFVDAEVLVGAAGGGGMAVGGGLVWQGNASLGYQITDSLSISAGYGRIDAMKGRFAADVVNVSLGYKFTLPTL